MTQNPSPEPQAQDTPGTYPPATPPAPQGAVASARTNGTGTASGTRKPAEPRVTRASMIWVAVATALVVLVLLIVFILQNQEAVQVKFFGLEGTVALGVALFIAAVAGGVLVAVAGAARILQLRAAAKRR
jgi:uncharacterized integral membrane protein